MKGFMTFVNVVLLCASVSLCITNLFLGNFGFAWIFVIPLFYTIGNIVAINIE